MKMKNPIIGQKRSKKPKMNDLPFSRVFRMNIVHLMKLENISLTSLVSKYCRVKNIHRTDSQRKKVSRIIFVQASSRKYITLEDVEDFSKIFNIPPAILAFGTKEQINTLYNHRPTRQP